MPTASPCDLSAAGAATSATPSIVKNNFFMVLDII
jgi:hypothetical protein